MFIISKWRKKDRKFLEAIAHTNRFVKLVLSNEYVINNNNYCLS